MGRALSSGSGERPAWVGRATFAAEAATVATLAYLLARLAVAAYPPLVETPLSLGVPAERPAAQSWSTLDPFRAGGTVAAAAPEAVADAPATTLNLVLVGLRAGGDGRGSAIIQTPDNQQRLYRAGDAILADATLVSVDPDGVTIRRQDGSSESLKFEARTSLIGGAGDQPAALPTTAAESEAAVAPAAAEREGPAGPVNARALITDITPFERAAGGIVVMPGADGTAFAAAGLEPFDVVLSVNGVGLANPETWQTAFANLGSGSSVSVELQRAGEPVTIQFVLE